MPWMTDSPMRFARRGRSLRTLAVLALGAALVIASGLSAAAFSGSTGGPAHSQRVCGKGPQGRLVDVAMTFIDGINSGDFAAWHAVLADDFTAIYAPTGPAVLDAETAELVNQSFIVANPDMEFAVDRVLVSASCDAVVIYWTATGTNTGPTTTPSGDVVPPTGLPWTVPGVYTAEIRDGEIVRELTHWDQLAALVQLGLVTLP